MTPSLLRRLISEGDTPEVTLELTREDAPVFWVDWSADFDSIVFGLARVLGEQRLGASRVGGAIAMHYRDRSDSVPETTEEPPLHEVLLAANRLLLPELEIRLVWASTEGDGLAFAPLPCADWRALEQEFGPDRVAVAFLRLGKTPDVFNDRLIRPSGAQP
jgi:hypothetical protein